jgi:trimeric autotransporter adhesin
MKSAMRIFLATIIAVCILLAGCGGGGGSTQQQTQSAAVTVSLQSIGVSPAASSLPLGRTQQLTTTGTFSDHSTKDLSSTVAWTSSNPAVATVGNGGLVTTKSQGNATITATSGSISGTAIITVTAPVAVSLAVSPASASIPMGLTQPFTATATLSDGTSQDLTQSATWSSSDTSVATVESNGVLTALQRGSVTVSAISGLLNSAATVTVIAPALRSIIVTPDATSLAMGQTQQFTAYGIYSDNSQQDLSALVTWTSTNSAVADVSAAGLAHGVSTGDVSMVATYNLISGTALLQVTSANLIAVTISPDLPSIAAGGFQQFTATGDFSDGSSQDLTNGVTWDSDNAAVATVSASGLAAGLTTGSAQISGCVGSVCDSTQLTVTPATLVSIAVSPATASIAMGTTQQFTAVATFSDGSSSDITTGASWSSSAPAVATISTTGLASGNGVGAGVTITATSGLISGTATLEVTAAVLNSITVTPAMPVLGINSTQQFTATGIYSDGNTQDLSNLVVWTSSEASVAVISNTGLLTALAKGTADISAAYGSITGSTSLSVIDVTLLSITVNNSPNSPAPPLSLPVTMGKRTRLQFYAWGAYSDGSDRRLIGVTWASSKPNVASINGGGLVRSKRKADTVTISANFGGVTGSVSLKVTAAALQSVSINPATASIAPGTTQQFVLTGTYTDGSTQDLTSLAYWQSSPFGVATINKGLATAVASGTASISANYQGMSAAPATLTVTNATLQSITISPSNPVVILGEALQFTATGNFSDATQQDLTLQVQWTSSNSSVAVIATGGLATSGGRGLTTIGATFGSVANMTLLTVN